MAGFEYNIDYYEEISSCDLPPISGVQYRVINELAVNPVSVDFFKDHARIDFDTDDTLITQYLNAALYHLQSWGQISFGIRTIGLTALRLPKNYRLMFGPVDTVATSGFSNVGDILKEGGFDVDIEYTTLGILNDTIRIAICRYAAGLYVYRENIMATKLNYDVEFDAAKKMIEPYINKIWF